MIAQQNKLQNLFSKHGWKVLEKQIPGNFRVAEFWLLKSLWSPIDCYIFIEFEVDPQCEVRVEKEKNVWAINISLKQPQDWQNDNFDIKVSDEEFINIHIKPNFEKRIPEIFEAMKNLRLKFNNLTD